MLPYQYYCVIGGTFSIVVAMIYSSNTSLTTNFEYIVLLLESTSLAFFKIGRRRKSRGGTMAGC